MRRENHQKNIKKSKKLGQNYLIQIWENRILSKQFGSFSRNMNKRLFQKNNDERENMFVNNQSHGNYINANKSEFIKVIRDKNKGKNNVKNMNTNNSWFICRFLLKDIDNKKFNNIFQQNNPQSSLKNLQLANIINWNLYYVDSKSKDNQISQSQPPKKIQKEIPQTLICSISGELMENPVIIANCGHTFDQNHINQWLSQKNICPLCKSITNSKNLQKNYALIPIIEQYKAQKF